MRKKTLLWILLLFLVSYSSFAQRLTVEGGFNISGAFPSGTPNDVPLGTVGFLGQASFEIGHWAFGALTRGMVSDNAPLNLHANGYNIQGSLARRLIGLGLFTRYFFPPARENKKWYLELAFLGTETDFIHANLVYVIPQSQDYTRLFLRGAGFYIGAGYRLPNSNFFFQINYELDHYETLEVVGDVKYLHPILAEPALDNNYFIHSIILVVGLDIFGKRNPE